MSFSGFVRRIFGKSATSNDRDPRHSLGAIGEKAALNHLKYEGYRIRAVNYRTKQGEIDIIAQEKDCIAFVEVRSLSSEEHGDAFSTVTNAKRHRLTKTAHQYLTKYKLTEVKWRFDFISVVVPEDGIPRVKLIRNAFPPVSHI
jgi:putative endonuclease